MCDLCLPIGTRVHHTPTNRYGYVRRSHVLRTARSVVVEFDNVTEMEAFFGARALELAQV